MDSQALGRIDTVKKALNWIVLAELLVVIAAGGILLFRKLHAGGSGHSGEPVVTGDKWKHLAGGTLDELHSPAILIEKSQRWLVVFDGEKPVKAYRAALGFGRGDKQREGDGCTPEGRFHVCVKNPKAKFTLSLGISYPNIEDAERGLKDGLITQDQHDRIVRAVRAGRQPPWKTPLGGEIMIHGSGSGRDWTRGCIALDDADIRELYRRIPVGTAVTILR